MGQCDNVWESTNKGEDKMTFSHMVIAAQAMNMFAPELTITSLKLYRAGSAGSWFKVEASSDIQTSIYTVHVDTAGSYVKIYDSSGKVLRTFEVLEGGTSLLLSPI